MVAGAGVKEPKRSAAKHRLWVGTLLGIYLLPSTLALARGHRNRGAVVALNVLAGWTIVGWIIAFIWSIYRDPSSF